MKTLLQNIYKSLWQNRITKYEDSALFELDAESARNLSNVDYRNERALVIKNPVKYQNAVYKKILNETKYQGSEIHFFESEPEGILINENINGFYDKLTELGY
jgi:hypothetical protein